MKFSGNDYAAGLDRGSRWRDVAQFNLRVVLSLLDGDAAFGAVIGEVCKRVLVCLTCTCNAVRSRMRRSRNKPAIALPRPDAIFLIVAHSESSAGSTGRLFLGWER
jgi:hypothetical protein